MEKSIGTDKGSLDDPLFTEALERAKRESKPIVLDFMASWCIPCKRMEKETFADPEVEKLLNQDASLKVDTDEHPDLAKHFGIEGLPDIRFLDSDGTEVRRLTDFQDRRCFRRRSTNFFLRLMKTNHWVRLPPSTSCSLSMIIPATPANFDL